MHKRPEASVASLWAKSAIMSGYGFDRYIAPLGVPRAPNFYPTEQPMKPNYNLAKRQREQAKKKKQEEKARKKAESKAQPQPAEASSDEAAPQS